MQSTLTLREADPRGAFAIKPDVVLAARANANQPLPDPVHEALSHLSRRRAQMALGAAVGPAPATPAVDTTFRAAAVAPVKVRDDRPAMRRWARNAVVAFLFALGSAAAAEAWKHHGDTARAMISNWVPPSVLASFAPAETPAPAGQPDSPPAPAAVADQAPAQPAPAAAAPNATTSPADSTQLLPSMARDLSAMGQQIEQLKSSIEELRAGQAQMSRDIAKNSETKASDPRVAALPPRPITPPPRKPRPILAPAQAATASTLPPPPPYAVPPYPAPPQPALSQPVPPPQATFQPDGEPVMRPPMPLH